MKKLMPGGGTLIVVQPAFKHPHAHDTWSSHAPDVAEIGIDACASGAFVVEAHFNLKDGNLWYYPYFLAPDYTTAQAFVQVLLTWTFPGYSYGAVGEWYNYDVRHLGFDKVTVDNWTAWLDAH
jgi:hypothetical protein